MSQTVIRTVTSKSEMGKFIRFQWEIYRSSPQWVPPLLMDRRKLVDTKKNPFFKHADIEFYLAERNGIIVGRIGAIVNHNHTKEHGDATGFFGFFECIDDQTVADVLLGRAEEFLRSHGMKAMRGPATPSVNDEYGLLIEGFEYPPAVLMSYNPAYYASLLEGYGLRKTRDLVSYLLSQDTVMSEKLQRVTQRVRERQGVTIRPMNMKEFDNEIERVKAIYNTAWASNWGAVSMTDQEIESMAADLKQVIVPEVVLFAEKEGKTVGFALSLPDINIPLKYNTKGYLLPGIVRLMWHKKKINLVRIIALGVLPEYLSSGIAGVLFYETAARAKPLGYDFGEAGWVLEDNLQMVRAAEMMKGKPYKNYRVYEKTILSWSISRMNRWGGVMPVSKSQSIWMNGVLVPWDDAKIHILSHVVHYGSSWFEGIRCYDTKKGSAVFRLDAHIRRLFDSVKIYRSQIPYSERQIEEAILETVRANGLKACYIRPLVYRGYGEIGVNPTGSPVEVAIAVWEWGAYLGKEALERGIDTGVASWQRPAPNTVPTMAKAGGELSQFPTHQARSARSRICGRNCLGLLRKCKRGERGKHFSCEGQDGFHTSDRSRLVARRHAVGRNDPGSRYGLSAGGNEYPARNAAQSR